MHRFFVPRDCIQGSLVRFQDPIAHQIHHVLRLVPNDKVIVLDGNPVERVVRLTAVERGCVAGTVEDIHPIATEPQCQLSLYVGMTQRAKFEWILQKGTELGVSSFIPVITSRSLVRETTSEPRRKERWEGILREAAEQSHRGRIPELKPVHSFHQALVAGANNKTICLIPWEEETAAGLKDILGDTDKGEPRNISLLIGPEGGFSSKEVREAIEEGWTPISMGPRILRMETAALAAVVMLLYELGEFNPPNVGAISS